MLDPRWIVLIMSKCTENQSLVLGGVQVMSCSGSLDLCHYLLKRHCGVDLNPGSNEAVLFVSKQRVMT